VTSVIITCTNVLQVRNYRALADALCCFYSQIHVAALVCTKWCHGWHLKIEVKLKIRPRQSMPIYAENIPTKFHPDCTWNDGALGFLVKWRHGHQPPSSKYDVRSEMQLRQLMRIHMKNNPAKFHSNPIWNRWALGFCGRGHPNKSKNKKKKKKTTKKK